VVLSGVKLETTRPTLHPGFLLGGNIHFFYMTCRFPGTPTGPCRVYRQLHVHLNYSLMYIFGCSGSLLILQEFKTPGGFCLNNFIMRKTKKSPPIRKPGSLFERHILFRFGYFSSVIFLVKLCFSVTSL
jgi:hypothetical protein